MNCVCCGSASVADWPEVTARGYRRFRCRDCWRRFNERSAGVLNRTCLPSDVVAFVVFCRLRYRLTLRDLTKILALRGIQVSHEPHSLLLRQPSDGERLPYPEDQARSSATAGDLGRRLTQPVRLY